MNNFKIIEQGYKYQIPTYTFSVSEKIINKSDKYKTIKLISGDHAFAGNECLLHEDLLQLIIHDLKYKVSLFPSLEGISTISHLQESLDCLISLKKK